MLEQLQTSAKKELIKCVKHHVPLRGNRIFWGRPKTGEMRTKRRDNELGGEGPGGGGVPEPTRKAPSAFRDRGGRRRA